MSRPNSRGWQFTRVDGGNHPVLLAMADRDGDIFLATAVHQGFAGDLTGWEMVKGWRFPLLGGQTAVAPRFPASDQERRAGSPASGRLDRQRIARPPNSRSESWPSNRTTPFPES